MSTVLRIDAQGKAQTAFQPALPEGDALDTRIALIQALIPLGLQAVADVLREEVRVLAGPRYARGDGAPHVVRWGRQRGSVYLADQKLSLTSPGCGIGTRAPRSPCRAMRGSSSLGRRMRGCCGGSCTG